MLRNPFMQARIPKKESLKGYWKDNLRQAWQEMGEPNQKKNIENYACKRYSPWLILYSGSLSWLWGASLLPSRCKQHKRIRNLEGCERWKNIVNQWKGERQACRILGINCPLRTPIPDLWAVSDWFEKDGLGFDFMDWRQYTSRYLEANSGLQSKLYYASIWKTEGLY